jgi:hypothetical protein
MYHIGQLRRNQITSYSTPINYTIDLLKNENDIITFYDPCIFLTGTNTISSLYSYYLRFEVTQLTNSVQDFTIKLKNSELEVDSTQTIRSFSVKQGVGTSVFELIFNSNTSYNEIIFELSRLDLDFGINSRIMDIKILDFYIVNNVISNYLSTNFSDLTKLKKIGIQGPPGLLFVIDGEEFRIGRTGIYELYNENITISYIGFVIKDSSFTQDGKDFFVMDFKY